MPKKFTKEQINWIKSERRRGRGYDQIENDFPIKFPGEDKPSYSAVYSHASTEQVLVEVPLEEVEDESLEETEVPTRPVSEEKKKKEDKILNELIAGKSVTDILKDPEFHHDMVFRMKKVYERDVISDKFTRYKNLLVGAGVYNAKSKSPIIDGILSLVEIAGQAESDLEFFKSTAESKKNEIFRGYQEREEDLTGKLQEQETTSAVKIKNLERTIRENKKSYNFKEGQWANEFESREKEHAKNIEVWKQKVRDILYHTRKYEAVINFIKYQKAPDALTEAYLKGIFNAVAILYAPFIVDEKFRRRIENKLERAVKQRDWNQFMSVIVELAKKVGPKAEEWVKRESLPHCSSRFLIHRCL